MVDFDLGLALGLDRPDGQGLLQDVAPADGHELERLGLLAAGEEEIEEHEDEQEAENAHGPFLHGIPRRSGSY